MASRARSVCSQYLTHFQRHLAQEDKMKETKSKDELEQTKSTKSLKNWGEFSRRLALLMGKAEAVVICPGHDPLKNM